MIMEENVPTSAGLSSYNLLDEQKLFSALSLDPGMHLLDFGCGVGNYTIAAAPYVGTNGRVCAVDLWEEGVETLELRAAMAHLDNIRAVVQGAGNRLPYKENYFDLCLMATVVHILVQEQLIKTALHEVKRVLKPDGRVAVVEFYKKEGPPGPPLSWRLSPEELQHKIADSGFRLTKTVEVGPHNYLSLFNTSSAQ